MTKIRKLNTDTTELNALHPLPAREEELSNKLAELTKEMNQFTYIVSHDLQAPLRTVTGFLELLERRYADKLDTPAKQFIEYAVKGAAKMKSLVFDLLELSRLNSVKTEFMELDMNLVLQEVKEKMVETITTTGAVITADPLPVVLADKKQVTQLFQHLLQNAIKFRGSDAPWVSITAKEEKGNWLIGIKDNGMGIDAPFFEKIFIIFRRLHTDEVKYNGTGTGLAICKKIIELHGGNIWVESEIDKGSTFWFTLPMKITN